MNLKTGDQVKILAGKDRGKTGKVQYVDGKSGRITVEGINLHIRHQRPKKQGEKGQKLQIPSPIHPSNLILVCPHCGKTTRIGHKIENGIKARLCKNCGKSVK